MERYDTDKYLALQNRDKTIQVISFIIVISFELAALIYAISRTTLVSLLLLAISAVLGFFHQRIVMSIVGTGYMTKKYRDIIKYHISVSPCSSSTLGVLENAAKTSSNEDEKLHFMTMLADQYNDAGDMRNAERVLDLMDRQALAHHPMRALEYYTVVMEFYDTVGDYDSVLRAFEDGKYYFEKYGEKNFTTYSLLLSAYTCLMTAHKNYPEAERTAMWAVQRSAPISAASPAFNCYIYGAKLTKAAECCCRNGNIPVASDCAGRAMQVLPPNTFFRARAERVMNYIGGISDNANNS